MPYFTKKGIGKNKGKTCVYKKEDRTKVGCTDGPIEKYLAALHINESQENDFDWIRDIDPYLFVKNYYEFYSDNYRIKKMASDYTHLRYSSDNITGLLKDMGVDESMDKSLLKKALIKYYKDNISQIRRFLSLISYNPMHYNFRKVLDNIQRHGVNESEDGLDWIRGIEVDLIPGEIYDIKSGNGYYWFPEKFIGKKWDDEYGVEMYKFKSLEGGSYGGKSVAYVKDLIKKGHIRPHEPNWSIKDDLTFSDNIEDALKGNFVIYFKDGVYLDQTLPIQDKLFEMGFSFYTKGPNEYITNNDSSDKIQFFESFNWDNSNSRYSNMPSDQRDQKKILLSAIKDDKFRFGSKPNYGLDEQELFLTVKDHDAIVINGDKYVTNNINESDEWDWVKDIPGEVGWGERYRYFEAYFCYDLFYDENTGENECFDGASYFFKIPESVVPEIWDYEAEDEYLATDEYEINRIIDWALENEIIDEDEDIDGIQFVTEHHKMVWCVAWGNYRDKGECSDFLKESTEKDFDWIRKQEPEKELKKSKRYVVDVSHLRPAPMKHSHDTSLTKQDILIKLGEIGYDVDHIDVDEAKYFYIEPTDGGPSWTYDEYGHPIEYYYWVDYNTDIMDDPSYGGKYHMVDVDEFMFLIDNNLISESEDPLKWLRDVGLGKVDLRNCKPGDILVTRSGKTVTYVRPLPKHDYMDHEIKYANGAYGSRTDDGYVYRRNRLDTDEDIISILEIKLDNIKKTVNENSGISFESRKWAEIIYNEIISNSEEKNRIIIDGYNYPKAFEGFPIDYVVIDFYDRLTGYGQEHSGYDKDGNYIVLLYIQPGLVMGQGGYSLQSVLNHEMKHAWEDYNRLSKGLPSLEQTKESQEMYNKDYILMLSNQNVSGPIKEILKYYYYLSNLEKSAYLENVYDKNPQYEKVVRGITSKDFESFKDRFDLDVNWHLMNTAYDIPFLKKFKSPIDFIDYSAKELRSRALKMIKKMNKMKYIHGK